jgi:hypothetical protein
VAPDGRFIKFNGPVTDGTADERGPQVVPVRANRTRQSRRLHFSPDGKWIAYNSNESGIWQVYLAPFPPTEERWQISANGGAEVRWRSDERELYYLSLEGQMMAVDVQQTHRPTLGEEPVLFHTGIAVNPRQDHYAVSADGQRFLIRREVAGGGRLPLTVVLSWTSGSRGSEVSRGAALARCVLRYAVCAHSSRRGRKRHHCAG